ncbi:MULTISPECIES: glycine zipper 2TM domain-containing protein [Sphingomonas]|uniref:glycine zipper 2TM domain-containing protein n=1 Tax=Sphingomonas TaxID=13687 RepID=UPI000F7DE0EC|nr:MULTISPECIES: glycine zipper 2TM domain-containing protein [unclassified Sphingomonas]MCG7347964.1 glycine zipper 2TM domain-containing protein [Sphingomonas sp. ACRSK]RSV13395.1 glycine zipper 2TM domain-containing protein [Sphingomonas sp. ABOLF]GLK20404.1 hypothetical protein GCM10017606_12300 [Microbacterium terregens]
MFKKLSLAGAALAMGFTALVPTAPAVAQSRHYYGDRHYDRGYDRGYDRRYDRGYDRRSYRGNDRRYYNNRNYRRCDNGDGGTVIGAVAGGLLGNQVAGRGDRLLGTVLGGAVGAVAGRAIDRSDSPRRCR